MSAPFHPFKQETACQRCGSSPAQCHTVLANDNLMTLCIICIDYYMGIGVRVSNFPFDVNEAVCPQCEDTGASLLCSSCAEGEFVNKCDNCGSDNQVLCQSCASDEWGGGSCETCGDPAVLCSYHAECASCGNRAQYCEDCSPNNTECENCSCEAVLCRDCAVTCCATCGAEGGDLFCSACAEPECVICHVRFDINDVVCPKCKQTKAADGVVTFDPNSSYTIRYKED